MTKRKVLKILLYVIPVVMFGIAYYFCWRYAGMTYLTNDDMSIQNYLSGFVTGENDPSHQFISIFLGYAISFLYRIIPSVQWWFVYSQFLMIVGSLIVAFLLIYRARGREGKTVIALVLVLVFIFLFFIPGVSETSFTIVPAFIGTGAISLLSILLEHKKHNVLITCISVLVFFVAFIHRKDSSYVILAYFLLMLIYILIKQGNNFKLIVIKFATVAIIMVLISLAFSRINNRYKETIDGAEFQEYNQARSEFMDYPKDAYDDNPNLYNEIGWDRDTYLMANQWCFIDERINADSFHTISTNSNAHGKSMSDVWKKLWGNNNSRHLIYSAVFIILAMYLFVILSGNWLEIAAGALDIAGSVIFIVYQLIKGRILYRSIVIIFIPAFVVMAILMVKCELDLKKLLLMPKRITSCITLLIMLGLFALSMYKCVQLSIDHLNVDKELLFTEKEVDNSVNLYLINNKQNTYIVTNVKTNIFPELIYPNENIVNALSWGGSEYKNHVYWKRLEKAGIIELNKTVFLLNNVYLVSPIDDEVIQNSEELKTKYNDSAFYALKRLLKESYPDKNLMKVDTICEGAYVYKLE